jgi:hypothetical protein
MPFVMLIFTLETTLLLWLLNTLTNVSMVQEGETPTGARLSISRILRMTAFVAFLLAFCQLYDLLFTEGITKERSQFLLISMTLVFLPSAVTTMLLFVGLTKPWWFALVVLVLAIPIESLGTMLAHKLHFKVFWPDRYNSMTYSMTFEHFKYSAVQATMILVALSTAKLLGIRYSIGASKQPATPNGTATVEATNPLDG